MQTLLLLRRVKGELQEERRLPVLFVPLVKPGEQTSSSDWGEGQGAAAPCPPPKSPSQPFRGLAQAWTRSPGPWAKYFSPTKGIGGGGVGGG